MQLKTKTKQMEQEAVHEKETDKPEPSASPVVLPVTSYFIWVSIKKWQLQIWVWPLYLVSAGSISTFPARSSSCLVSCWGQKTFSLRIWFLHSFILHQHLQSMSVPPENRVNSTLKPVNLYRYILLAQLCSYQCLFMPGCQTSLNSVPWSHMGGLHDDKLISQTIPLVVFLEPEPEH